MITLKSKMKSLMFVSKVLQSHSKDISSVAQSCLTLCDPMDCSMTGFLVHHQLLELTQTHVHWVSDAIQPSHLWSSPSPPAFNLSQHQVFSNESVLPIRPKYWSSSSASVLPMNIQGWSPLGLTGLTSLLFKGLSRVFSNTTVQKHQFFWHSAFFIVQFSHPTKRDYGCIHPYISHQ